MPEVGVAGPGRDHEAVVGHGSFAVDGLQVGDSLDDVDRRHDSEHDADVALATEHVPDWRRDLALGEDACRDLVEQRLEQVLACSVDQRHLHGGAPERLRGEEATEP